MPNSVPQLKEAIIHCKALLRNGHDAYVINAPLQKELILQGKSKEVDIACAIDFPTLAKIFPSIEIGREPGLLAILNENEHSFRFYATDIEHASYPELGLVRMTPRMLDILHKDGRTTKYMAYAHSQDDEFEGFEDIEKLGCIQLEGLPTQTLRRNYLLAVRALRFSANYELPIEANTWLAIVQSISRILDYVPTKEIMDEWRMVSAKNMHIFVRLLTDTHLLHGLMPEVAALARVMEPLPDGTKQYVLDHTIECMRHYPQDEEFAYDWMGVMSVLFHDVGKLYTGEFVNNQWTFYQHHRVGAGVTRKILRRLHFSDEDIDLICHLVRNHMHFQFMLTDRGIRRFSALDENRRLIAMCKSNILARGASNTNFNHNSKYLMRAQTAEIMLEPLLNGNEIMEYTNLPQGPTVGAIREALLQAQIAGEVTDHESAIAFVKKHKAN